MKQIYHPYWEWEDYKAGMWTKVPREEEHRMLKKAIEFTGDWMVYSEAMHQVIFEWPITMEHNLTNPSRNQKAFVGHCAACWKFGIPEYVTRAAWKTLTDQQQGLANFAAGKAIAKWGEWFSNKSRQRSLF